MGGSEALKAGEVVLVRRDERDSFLVALGTAPQSVDGRGVIDLSGCLGKAPGEEIVWAGARYRVLRPALADLLEHARRKAQIVTPKDAQYLLYLAGVGPGGRVAEAGAGSGALTLCLAHAVGPQGTVFSYDRRPEFLSVAQGNIAQAGWAARVRFRTRDVATEGFDESALDSVLLDLPEPWGAIPAAYTALRPGGRIATFTPTYNQLERTVRALRDAGFQEVRALELLERALHVGAGGTRPDFDMLGHTGFLAGGCKG
jgi:tRNA (adenine57-N1/adenine58-N1)-methyltransferase catalytic subunit